MQTLISSNSLRPSIYLFSPSKLAFHYSPAWDIVSHIMPVTSDGFHITISYSIWVSKIRDSHTHTHTQNIVNWYRNRSTKTISSYILLFEHGRRMNSTYQIMQTIGNSAECYDDFGSMCFICNMSTKESRYHINNRIPNLANG